MTVALMLAAMNVSEAQGQTGRRRAASRRSTRPAASRPVAPASASPAAAAATTTPSGLTYLITRHGNGRQPKAGEIVLVHYTGTLANGVKFDSSRDRNDPIAFKLGAGRVIKGWDEGVAHLRVGDQAVLIIPPQIGYGSKGAGGGVIPPDATLIFIIEVMDVKATSLSEILSQTLQEKNLEAMIAQYRELKTKGLGDIYTSESELNAMGYRLLANNRVSDAIEVFKLNVEAYPNSANVYDSLAEGYLAQGDKQLAIENYRKALELDPQSESARKALNALTGN
ncbi:MAG TPA: FKBP-type peptidyl-prolyl cis-trans isomerase [Pyrinomonadaceae bacterium]|jgi:FKBP-type peptidyl-prolyl cis-trans isomerase